MVAKGLEPLAGVDPQHQQLCTLAMACIDVLLEVFSGLLSVRKDPVHHKLPMLFTDEVAGPGPGGWTGACQRSSACGIDWILSVGGSHAGARFIAREACDAALKRPPSTSSESSASSSSSTPIGRFFPLSGAATASNSATAKTTTGRKGHFGACTALCSVVGPSSCGLGPAKDTCYSCQWWAANPIGAPCRTCRQLRCLGLLQLGDTRLPLPHLQVYAKPLPTSSDCDSNSTNLSTWSISSLVTIEKLGGFLPISIDLLHAPMLSFYYILRTWRYFYF